jgi:hypothetical protein
MPTTDARGIAVVVLNRDINHVRRTLDGALDERDLDPFQRHLLSQQLRAIISALPFGSGPMTALSGHLKDAARVLVVVIDGRR